jgi:hypothetical protein
MLENTEGTIKYGQCRETGNTKGQSKMDNAGKLATRRGNQKWTMQGNWQHEGAIKNGQCRETGNIGYKIRRKKQHNKFIVCSVFLFLLTIALSVHFRIIASD